MSEAQGRKEWIEEMIAQGESPVRARRIANRIGDDGAPVRDVTPHCGR